MAQFIAFATNVEVNGETVRAVIDGMGAFTSHAMRILAENGITDPVPGQWYSQQAWLNAFKDIAEKLGDATLFAIGLSIPRNAKFPPGIDTLGKALGSINEAYQMNHRGGPIGNYTLKRTGDRSAAMVCDNPYPCEFDRGIISAMTDRFPPKGFRHKATVRHDSKSGCRKKGANACVYLINW